MHTKKNLQDNLLNSIRKSKQPATVFLTNGFQLHGTITGFDSFVILLQSDSKQQIIYKHAVSTIIPFKPVEHQQTCEEEESLRGYQQEYESN